MTKYEKLDSLILSSIEAGRTQFNQIFAGTVHDECERIAKAEGTTRSRWGVDPFRVMDRRLQALRKAGKIRFVASGDGMGWQLIPEA